MSNVVAAILLGNGVGGRMAIAPHYSTVHRLSVTMHSPRKPLHTALNITYLQICLLIFQKNSWRKFEHKEATQDMHTYYYYYY